MDEPVIKKVEVEEKKVEEVPERKPADDEFLKKMYMEELESANLKDKALY